MQHAKDIPELDKAGLRRFGYTTGIIVAALFGVFLPWVFDAEWPVWPWVLGGILVFAGLVIPAALRSVYRGWMRLGMILNKVTTPIIMGLVFFLMITPIGLIRRLLASDPLSRELRAGESYRVRSKQTNSDMEKPY
jgi:hypothetical protein